MEIIQRFVLCLLYLGFGVFAFICETYHVLISAAQLLRIGLMFEWGEGMAIGGNQHCRRFIAMLCGLSLYWCAQTYRVAQNVVG